MKILNEEHRSEANPYYSTVGQVGVELPGIKRNFSKIAFKAALKDSIPVFFGYLPVGFVFGLLLLQHGHPWYLAPLMSITSYTGTTQLLAIGMIEANVPLFTLFSTKAIIDLRHLFYSISMVSRFPQPWRNKWYLTHGLTDETYSILTSRPPLPMDDDKYCLYLTLLNHFYWVASSLLGACFGLMVKIDIPALNFVLTALFLVLFVEHWRESKSNFPFYVALVAAAIGMLVFSRQMLLISLVLTTVTLFFKKEKLCII